MYGIIAGTNKAGTTSLFRYLSDHPNICPSKIKEANFFREEHPGTTQELLTSYQACFPECGASSSVYLESTPSYLAGGRRIAARIHRVIPDARLVFILREPVSRLLSFYFQNRNTRFNEGVAKLSLEAFVSLLETAAHAKDSEIERGPMQNARIQFQRGCYAHYLREYLEYFPSDRILIIFFDELASDTQQCVSEVAGFLGIDARFFDGYAFRAENKTRQYRYAGLHKLIARVNTMLESQLNRYPFIRRALRSAYLSLNQASKQKKDAPTSVCQRLDALYRPHNEALSQLLAEAYPRLSLPVWLRQHGLAGLTEKENPVSVA